MTNHCKPPKHEEIVYASLYASFQPFLLSSSSSSSSPSLPPPSSFLFRFVISSSPSQFKICHVGKCEARKHPREGKLCTAFITSIMVQRTKNQNKKPPAHPEFDRKPRCDLRQDRGSNLRLFGSFNIRRPVNQVWGAGTECWRFLQAANPRAVFLQASISQCPSCPPYQLWQDGGVSSPALWLAQWTVWTLSARGRGLPHGSHFSLLRNGLGVWFISKNWDQRWWPQTSLTPGKVAACRVCVPRTTIHANGIKTD